MWMIIKYTMFGKVGVVFFAFAGAFLAVESMMESHVNAVITAIPPTLAVIVGVIALRKGQKTMMISIDGRMEQLLAVTAKSSKAEGRESERSDQRDRRDQIKIEIAQQTQAQPGKVQDVHVTNTKDDAVNSNIIDKP